MSTVEFSHSNRTIAPLNHDKVDGIQGRLQVSGKGGASEGLVGDCGLVFPVGVFCVKNQDFMQKMIFFPILVGVSGAPSLKSGSDKY